MKALSIFLVLLPVAIGFNDQVLPAPIKEKFVSVAGRRSENLDRNIRLLTVLSLLQNGFSLYGDHWYRFYKINLQWISAENFCRSLGGHLASIQDPAENEFIHELREKNNIWIGLNKINDSHQVYKWSDGTKAQYLNWDSTQPNEPSVDCVYMAYHQEQRGTWFDYGCSSALPQFFVCKLPMP